MYIRLHGLAQPRDPMPNVLPRKTVCPELPTIKNNNCFPYEPNEVQISHTAAGHLTPDVGLITPIPPVPNAIITCRYLIIRDFGVDWRHVKLAARSEQLFKDFINLFETNKSLLFWITGYSDCVGVERNNLHLRLGRARNVFQLFKPSARSRVMAVTAAPPQTFVTDNSTAERRAVNRSVVIQFSANDPQII